MCLVFVLVLRNAEGAGQTQTRPARSLQSANEWRPPGVKEAAALLKRSQWHLNMVPICAPPPKCPTTKESSKAACLLWSSHLLLWGATLTPRTASSLPQHPLPICQIRPFMLNSSHQVAVANKMLLRVVKWEGLRLKPLVSVISIQWRQNLQTMHIIVCHAALRIRSNEWDANLLVFRYDCVLPCCHLMVVWISELDSNFFVGKGCWKHLTWCLIFSFCFL